MMEYARLPKQAPDCYIATAAARGHRHFVGARDTPHFVINDQLCHLKCAELVIQSILPSLHRLLRRIYDLLGPRIARHLRHPLLADLAFLSLKPIEWVAMLIIHGLAPEAARLAPGLYDCANDSNTPASSTKE